MQIQGNITQQIGYVGQVELYSANVNGKKQLFNSHNAGCSDLFKSIARYLSGNINTLSDRPLYVDLRVEDSTQTFNSILKSKIPITSSMFFQDSSDLSWKTSYEAILEGTQLKNTQIYPSKNYRFYLTSEDADFAYIDVLAEALRFTGGTQIVVKWTMQFVGADSK